MKPQDDLRSQVVRSMAITMALGIDVAVVLLICVLAGHYLDGRLHSSPWGLLTGIVLGVAGGVVTAYRLLVRAFR